MVCTDQYQLCNPTRQGRPCTPLTAPILLKDEISKIGMNPSQAATVRLVMRVNALAAAEIDGSMSGRGASALLANEKVDLNIQSFLPSDQWMNEVRNWFAISLIKLQYGVVEFATGPTSPAPESAVFEPPYTPEGWNLCRSIKAPNPGGYQSFSVLGLAIILIVGGAIIIISIILEPLTHYFFKKWNSKHSFRRLQWILDGKLQLQRIAYEYAGIGVWTNKEKSVPITTDDAKVFQLDGILSNTACTEVRRDVCEGDNLITMRSDRATEPQEGQP